MRVRDLPLRLAPVVLLLSLALHALAVVVWTRGLTALYDLGVYRSGGRAIIDGTPLYDGNVFWLLKFTYPPFAAVLFTRSRCCPPGGPNLLLGPLNVARR